MVPKIALLAKDAIHKPLGYGIVVTTEMGAHQKEENILVNPKGNQDLQRLVIGFIYEGAAKWAESPMQLLQSKFLTNLKL